MKRRTVLGGLAAVATAGCLSNPASSGGSGGSDVRLARLSVKNEDSFEHTIHVIVKRGGDIAHWSSHTLDAAKNGGSRTDLSCTWGAEPGNFEILARLDDSTDWRSTIVGGDQADYYQASVEVDADGALGVWFSGTNEIPESGSCDMSTTTTESDE